MSGLGLGHNSFGGFFSHIGKFVPPFLSLEGQSTLVSTFMMSLVLGPSYDWCRLGVMTPVPAGTLNPSTILGLDSLEGHNLPKLVFIDLSLLRLHYIYKFCHILPWISVFRKEEGVFLYLLSPTY